MKNLKLGHRLIIGFGLLLLGMGVLGGIALAGLAQLRGLGRELVEHSLSGVYHAARVRANMLDAVEPCCGRWSWTRTRRSARRSRPTSTRRSTRSTPRARSTSAASSPTEDRRLFSEYSSQAREAFSKAREKVMALVEQDKVAEARTLYGDAAVPAFQTYLASVNALVEYNKRRGDEVGKEIVEAIASASGGIWVSFIVLTLLGVATAVLIGRSVVQRGARGAGARRPRRPG